jgi:predicted DNA-binding transcriptional regulator YafY
MKSNAGVAGALKVLRALMAGRTFDRHAVAGILGTKPPAADRVMRALRSMPGVSLDHGTISCDARYRLDAPTDVMVLAGAIALSVSRMFGGSAQATSMQRLLERLIGGARRRIVDVERKFFFVERGGEVALDTPEHAFDEISQAVRDSLEVTATYTASDGSPKKVQIRPLTILVYQHQLYVLAQSPARQTPYPFRVARMSHVELGDTFEYPSLSDYDPRALFEHTFGIFVAHDGPVETVEIRLTGSWPQYAQRHRWHKTQTLRADASACIVSLRVRVCPEVESWVLSFGEFGEVLAPTVLRARIAHRSAAASHTYATGTAPAATECAIARE